MCTAVAFATKDHYFGRNLDLEYSYNEKITITPRRFPFMFRYEKSIFNHYAIIGMAHISDNYPLYYDAINEEGLAMAGLNFPANAIYNNYKENCSNIAPFELIPWILSQCKTIDEAKRLLERTSLIKENFSPTLQVTPLHFMISDKDKSLTVEPVGEEIRIYDNPVGVLTNNPPFDYQMTYLSNFSGVSPYPAINRICDNVTLPDYSRGLGGIGLPGDLSSSSRFVRAVFTKTNSVSPETEKDSVNQFFHILSSVEQQRGAVRLEDNINVITVYSSCCNLEKGIYYVKTYNNHRISAVDIHNVNLENSELSTFSPIYEEDVLFLN